MPNSITTAWFGANGITTIDTVFYVNIALAFCALVYATAIVALCKKTSCAFAAGAVAAVLFGLGLALFCAQLVLYARAHANAVYLIYACTAALCAAFVCGGVYAGLLSRNSHKTLCIATGALSLVPPVGAALAVRLSYKIKKDTRGQALVFGGYAYTYAALAEFCACESEEAVFADGAGEESFPPLSGKNLKKRLRELKKKANGAEGMYDYACALVYYTPYDYAKAVKYMTKAADAKFAPAQFNLGYYYEIGAYVKKDCKKARSYYVKAADAGDADARLRLAIVEIKDGNAAEGMRILKDKAERGDLCAEYNIGVCAERGIGEPKDLDKALDIYADCANRGLYAAQKRIFVLASRDMDSGHNGEFFRRVTDRKFEGEFATIIDGLIEIKKRRAADAAEVFLKAVGKGGRWEGVARCLVGTLYIDCGKLPGDKKNGAEYIKSAVPLLPGAMNIYSVVPSRIVNGK